MGVFGFARLLDGIGADRKVGVRGDVDFAAGIVLSFGLYDRCLVRIVEENPIYFVVFEQVDGGVLNPTFQIVHKFITAVGKIVAVACIERGGSSLRIPRETL